jgi:lysophospholipase L1-like esterase
MSMSRPSVGFAAGTGAGHGGGMRRAGLVALCLLLATSCRFAIVGDSVVSISRHELGGRGGQTFANGGVDIVTGRDAIRRLAAERDQPIVIALGLMDTSFHASPGQIEDRIRRVLRDDVAHVECVIWVDLKQTSNVHREWGSRSRTFNRILADVAEEFDRPVARWSDAAADHPDWFKDDGVHPNNLGQRHYARFVAEAVDQHC